MTIGERIYYKRTELGMTMEELASKTGVQKSAVNKWEKGYVSNIKSGTIAKIAHAFDVSPVWLLGLEDDQQKQDEEEQRLLSLFRMMNDEGRAYLLKTAEMAARTYLKKDTDIPREVG
jgi:transcriptional regulator with XRE-family HTH domain